MPTSGEIRNRAQLIRALTDAAQIEHAVICQYLFAAHSLKTHPSEPGVSAPLLERVRQWKSNILEVARGEMEHLGLVCNLLSAVGGSPFFGRPNFPYVGCGLPPGARYELRPFSAAALEQFKALEASHEPGARWDDEDHETIGELYSRIRRGFEFLGSHDRPLFVGPLGAQVSNERIGLPERWYEIRLRRVVDRESALEVLDQILEEGHHGQAHRYPTHYERFDETLREYRALVASDPSFQPVRSVASNPATRDGAEAEGCSVVEHPVTRRAVRLFNSSYETMCLMLDRYYGYGDETEAERRTLEGIALFPFMTVVIRPLAEIIVHMPLRSEPSECTAGPAFETDPTLRLSPQKRSSWIYIHERLTDLVEECSLLRREVEVEQARWALAILPRLVFLGETLEALSIKFAHGMKIDVQYFRGAYERLEGR